jgi:hypothetical protein
MPREFVGKSTNYTKVRVIHRLYTTLYYHKNDGSASKFGMMREERSLKFKFES